MSKKLMSLVAGCVGLVFISMIYLFPGWFGIGDGVFSDTESAVVESGLELSLNGQPEVAQFLSDFAVDALVVINSEGYEFGDVVTSFSKESAVEAGLSDAQTAVAFAVFDKAKHRILGFFDNRTDVTREQKAVIAKQIVTLLKEVADAELAKVVK